MAKVTTKRAPAVPDWLGDYAKRKWSQLLAKSPALGQHPDTLALLCQSWHDYQTALCAITKDGQVIRSGDRLFVNPACNVKTEAWKQIMKASKVLGISPETNKDENVSPDLDF